jgi:hypothetical protein
MRRFLPVIGTAALLLPSALLGAKAVNSLVEPSGFDRFIVTSAAESPAKQNVTNPDTAEPLPQISYQAILDRPLFAPTRLPAPRQTAQLDDVPVIPVVVTEAPAVENAAIQPPAFEFKGVWGNSQGSVVYIKQPGLLPAWVGVGFVIDGWRVAEIGRNWLSLTQGRQHIRVSLFE